MHEVDPAKPARRDAPLAGPNQWPASSGSRETSPTYELGLQGLEDMGLPWPGRPDGAFYVYIDVSGTGLDAMRFCERVLQEAHVALTPGDDFGTCGAARHVRLSYAASQDDLREGLARLKRFVAGLAV